MDDEVAIKVDSVSKSFKLPHERQRSIKSIFIGMFSGKKTYEEHSVLKEISFEIKKGDFFGIVGRNGSGKSTLLKLLAGIYSPDQGEIQINGSLTPFIELGVGFNPELTGRENVFLNGALLGFSRSEIEKIYTTIVKFAELEKFMDQKLKNYSSGMQVRLAFSIAIRAKTDILLIDEVLAVGDAAFQKKCFDFFSSFKGKTTVVFVTHGMDAVKRFCNKVLVVDRSRSIGVYSPKEGAYEYEKIMDKVINDDKHQDNQDIGSKQAIIKKVNLSGGHNRIYELGEDIDLTFEIECLDETIIGNQLVVGVGFCDDRGVNIIGPNSKGRCRIIAKEHVEVGFSLKRSPFSKGNISINVGLFSEDLQDTYHFLFNAIEIKAVSGFDSGGIITYEDVKWTAKK